MLLAGIKERKKFSPWGCKFVIRVYHYNRAYIELTNSFGLQETFSDSLLLIKRYTNDCEHIREPTIKPLIDKTNKINCLYLHKELENKWNTYYNVPGQIIVNSMC